MTKIITLGNPKTMKSVDYGYLTGIVHLIPDHHHGQTMCPNASTGCKNSCLHTSGAAYMMPAKRKARQKRTALLLRYPGAFWQRLINEAKALARSAKKKGLKPALRIRGTHDRRPPAWVLRALAREKITVYDYTKNWSEPDRADYHLTYSKTENHAVSDVKRKIGAGQNVAVVFAGAIPATWQGLEVIDGTSHDLRFLDKRGVIVGLKALGKARKDATGFVVRDCEGPFIEPVC